MRIFTLLFVPTIVGIISLFIQAERRRELRRFFLSSTAAIHFVITFSLHLFPVPIEKEGFFMLDPIGLFFLSITSLLFFVVSIYSWGYFHNERAIPKEGVSHLFTPCMLFFLAAMTLTSVTDHLGILWIAIEGTTLASAPLIYYHHHEKALEATWKYLLICSVGIALALLGLFFIAAASGTEGADLDVSSLVSHAKLLETRWLRIGFILILVGFGTKMGLAPMHTWLPDAHSEAPAPVSALLSGALLNCAFLGIVRCYQICNASGLQYFTSKLLLIFGLISLFIAAAFIIGQRDYKRMLAYSSIEHMGIITFGLGVNSGFGSLLHVLNHSLTKSLLFLTAGQILVAYRTKVSSEIRGLLKSMPLTGLLFIFGGLAILGSPPLSPFISEFIILKDGLSSSYPLAIFLYLAALGIVFVGMSRTIWGMTLGSPTTIPHEGQKPSWPMILAPGILAIFVFVFGIYLPSPLVHFISSAVNTMRGLQ